MYKCPVLPIEAIIEEDSEQLPVPDSTTIDPGWILSLIITWEISVEYKIYVRWGIELVNSKGLGFRM